MKKTWFLWLSAFLITVLAAYYQRTTGPTNPKRVTVTIAETTYKLKSPRSLITEITPQQAQGDWKSLEKSSTLKITITKKEGVNQLTKETPIHLYFKRFRSADEWQMVEGNLDGSQILFTLPAQPPAGKIVYYLEIAGTTVFQDAPITMRFRNDVPKAILIPHILVMFAVMLLSTFCGLLALRSDGRWKKYAWITLATVFTGGLILGPIVQKFAFGAFWTGWPLGDDLTDTKTLVAACFWVLALIFSKKKTGRWLAILAAIVLLIVYSIPHSTAGSEFNYETGQVETGAK